MKTLFVVPPFPARTYPGKTMAPDYLAGALVNQGYVSPNDIDILDLDVLESDILEEKLKSTDYDLVGISFLSFQTDEAMQIAEKADMVLSTKGRRNPKSRDYIPIVVGGHGTSQADSIIPLYQEVDAWSTGEGLETILDIASSIRNGTFLEDRERISGLKYFKGNEVRTTSRRKLVERLDNFTPLRLNHYQEYDFDVFDSQKTAQVMSQVGCASSCVFCHESTAGKGVRERNIASIKKEIEGLIAQGYRAIYFDDSTFTWNRERTREIVELMRGFNKNHSTVWGFNTRVDCLDKELIENIRDSGCTYMFAGVESLTPEVLAGMNKVRGFTPSSDYQWYQNGKTEEEYVSAAKQVFNWMGEAGQTKSAFLIFGGPTFIYKIAEGKRKAVRGVEDFEQAKRTIDQAVWELDPEYISINIMRFIPDAVMSSSSKFSNLRGQDEKYHAGNFSRKWKDQHNLRTGEERQHPIYQAFEAAGEDYPIPPHMTPEYSYSILEHLVEQVNEKTQKTGKQTQIVVDKTFERYMQRDENGIYYLAPIEEMSVSESEVKPRTLRSRIKSYIRPAIAVATSLAIAVGSWIYVKDYDQNKEARMQQQRVREFYSRYYPGLLMEDGKLPSNRGMGLIDMLADESAAFVHGDIDNAIYGNNTHLTKLAEEGRAELAPSL